MGLYGMVPNDSRWANKQGKIAYGGGVYGAEIIISFSPQHNSLIFREFCEGMRMTTWGFVRSLFFGVLCAVHNLSFRLRFIRSHEMNMNVNISAGLNNYLI